jgi:hypothetical protein
MRNFRTVGAASRLSRFVQSCQGRKGILVPDTSITVTGKWHIAILPGTMLAGSRFTPSPIGSFGGQFALRPLAPSLNGYITCQETVVRKVCQHIGALFFVRLNAPRVNNSYGPD